jgi:hypothetical protein
MPPKPRLSISVTVRQLTRLTKEAGDLGLSIGELVRRIIDAYFNKR